MIKCSASGPLIVSLPLTCPEPSVSISAILIGCPSSKDSGKVLTTFVNVNFNFSTGFSSVSTTSELLSPDSPAAKRNTRFFDVLSICSVRSRASVLTAGLSSRSDTDASAVCKPLVTSTGTDNDSEVISLPSTVNLTVKSNVVPRRSCSASGSET